MTLTKRSEARFVLAHFAAAKLVRVGRECSTTTILTALKLLLKMLT
jgi:hypothetical protein